MSRVPTYVSSSFLRSRCTVFFSVSSPNSCSYVNINPVCRTIPHSGPITTIHNVFLLDRRGVRVTLEYYYIRLRLVYVRKGRRMAERSAKKFNALTTSGRRKPTDTAAGQTGRRKRKEKIRKFGRISVRLSGNEENHLLRSGLISFVEQQQGNTYRYVSFVVLRIYVIYLLNSSNKTTFITIVRPSEA